MSVNAEITCVERSIFLKIDYKAKDAAKAITGSAWHQDSKRWRYPKTISVAAEIVATFPFAKADDEFRNLVIEYNRQNSKPIERGDDLPEPPSLTKAWEHQKRAFWFAADMPGAMLAMDMGTGKTKVAVDLICHRDRKKVLITAPKSVVGVWPREFRRHAIKPYFLIPCLEEKLADRLSEAERKVRTITKRGDPFVVIINHDAVWRGEFGDWIMDTPWDQLIVDESHRAKAHDGSLSSFLHLLSEKVPYRLLLTGTPMPHSPLDVFAQFRMMDITVFGSNFNQFRHRYAILGGFGTKKQEVVGFQNQDLLQKKFFSLAYQVTKEEALDLPPFIHVDIPVMLSANSWRIYSKVKDEFYAELEKGEVTIANAPVKIMRLQQIANGFVNLDDGMGIERFGTEKADALYDLLTNVVEPVVVFCNFTADLEAVRGVAKKLNRRYGEISGMQKDLTPDSTYPEDIDILGVNLKAGGVGIDLTRAAHAIYYSNSFNMGDYHQSLARVHRPPQKRKVTYHHLIADGTMDLTIYNCLQRRENVIRHILGKELRNADDEEADDAEGQP